MKTCEEAKTMRVAVVQIESKHGCVEANHNHATPWIEKAADAGAQLVVLPELFASGYIPNETLWDVAETSEGPTISWLRRTSKRLRIYLGGGLVVTDGQDFYNIFVLTGPHGQIAGSVTKAEAESYIFKRRPSTHVINTGLGKIGVGICVENHFGAFLEHMREEAVDFVLMPHGWPTPVKIGKGVSNQDMQKLHEFQTEIPLLYATHLGVPVVFVNGLGTMARMVGILGSLMDPSIYRLEGHSRIIDSDGTVKGELKSEEGIIVAVVTLDPSRKHWVEPNTYDGWLHPGVGMIRKVIIPLENNLGQFWYTHNPRRRKKAQQIVERVIR
jgi:N-carbamoylputrescine amidase